MSTDADDEAGDAVSRRGFLRAAAGGAAVAGATGGAAAQEDGGGGGGGTETVAVGPGGSLAFEPAELEIVPGTTVEWVWKSDNHNVVVESQPDGADWEGQPADQTFDSGHTYSHTFETLGTYEYFCQPHRTAGMVGSISVVEELSGGDGGGAPTIPDSAKTLGLATVFGMLSTLGLAYFFLKYGGDYGTPE